MEVCMPHNTSAYQDKIDDSGSSPDPSSPARYSSGDISMSDLKACLTEIVDAEDLGKSTSDLELSHGKNDTGNLLKEDEHKDLDKSKCSNSTSKKCYSKSATFPSPGERKPSVDELVEGGRKHDDARTAELSEAYSRSISLPTPLKLVSAMKGSREQQGKTPMMLSVTWAPDVYDPTPTAASHVPSYRNYRYHNNGKKHGKNKQKGGGKRSKGKDKKQARKHSGSTSNTFKAVHDKSGGIEFSEPETGFADYNVQSSDPCGSSFLKKSVTKMHFPVAEAT